MKLAHVLIIFILLQSTQIWAQDEDKKEVALINDSISKYHKNYSFNTEIPIEELKIKKNTLGFESSSIFVESLNNQRFKVIGKDKEYFYIRIFDYRNNKNENNNNQLKYVKDGTNKYFRVKKEFFENSTDKIYPIYAGENFGVVSIPFKIRLGNDDFETNINIGLNLGLKYRLNRKVEDRWILQPNIGIGLSDIPLNERNSNVEEAENRTAMSLSMGLLLNISKDVNLGVFYGFDRLNKANQSVNWKYQNKGWLGFGINIGFASNKSSTSEIKNKDKE
ncbi:hypothetical protein [Psychroserpens sp.]